MKNEQQLESEISMKALELSSLRQQLHDMKMEGILPILREKYEGKYFKFNNAIVDERFFTYYKCQKINSPSEATVSSFEMGGGECAFSLDRSTFISLLEVEITEEEYKSALADFTQKFNQL